MGVPGFAPRFDDFGGRPGERVSASFLTRMQDELYAARSAGVSHPFIQENGPFGPQLGLDRTTLDLQRFVLTENLLSGSKADAQILIFDGTTGRWNIQGEHFDVYDSFGKTDGSIRLKSGAYGFAKWMPDNGLWEFVQISDAIGYDFFPARLDCRVSSSGTWVYSWTEMEWTSAIAAASVLSGGRTGYTAQSISIAKTTTGDGSTAEVETITFCEPPLVGGTWDVGGSTGLAFNVSAGTLQTALRASLSGTPLVTVTGSMSAGFVVTWPSVGAVTTMTGSVTNLLPAGPAWPATELNNRKVSTGTIVWMRLGYKPSSPAVAVVAKTASGNSAGVHAAFSLYLDQVKGGSFKLGFDTFTTADISYGSTAAQISTAITAAVSGLTLTSFSGAGTIGSPWTFNVTSDYADHTMTADGSKLKGNEGYRFAAPNALCGYEDVSGFDATKVNILAVDASGCLTMLHPSSTACP